MSDSENISGRIAAIEKKYVELKTTVDEIRVQVTNHIPTSLDELTRTQNEHGTILGALHQRVKDEKAVEKFFATWSRRLLIIIGATGGIVSIIIGVLKILAVI